jgi:PAS domain S-box-containing protein
MQTDDLQPLLYDLALLSASASSVGSLLRNFVERLLSHASLPAAVALEVSVTRGVPMAVVACAVGSAELSQLEGTTLELPGIWLTDDLPKPGVAPRSPFAGYGLALRLPIAGFGVLVLLGQSDYARDLSWVEQLSPILENLARVIRLCRAAEAQGNTSGAHRPLAATSAMFSDAELHRVQAISRTGSWVYDFETSTTRASREALRMMGLSSETPATKEDCETHVHPEDIKRLRAAWASLEQDGVSVVEFRVCTDGSENWLQQAIELERGSDGRPLHAYGVLTDVTEHRRVVRELERREKLYDAITERSVLGISLIDPATWHFEEFNDAACQLLGYGREEFAVTSVWDVLGRPCLSEYEELTRPIRAGDRTEFECQCRMKNGAIRQFWVSLQGLSLNDRTHVAALWLDITERKRAEEALRNREKIFSSIVSQAMDAVALIDLETGALVEFNQATYQDLGYTREEFVALGVRGTQADPAGEELRRHVEILRRDGCAQYETRHRHRSGEVRSVLVRARILTLWDHPYVAAVWSDITEQELAAQAMIERLRELNCLSQIRHLIETVPPLDELCRGIVEELARSMRRPDAAFATIELCGCSYESSKCQQPPKATLAALVRAGETIRGRVIAGYTDDSSFVLPEEQYLLDSVAHSLGLCLQRREAEAAQRRSETQYRLVAENAADLIWTMDCATQRITFISPAVTQLLGYAPEELLGRRIDEPVTQESAARFRQSIGAATPSPDLPPLRLDVDLVRKDGSIVNTEVTCRWSLDASGHLQAVGVTRDLTERRRAEAEIRKLSLAVEQSPDSIIISNLDSKIEYVNDAFLAITGYCRAEVIGKSTRILQSDKTPASTSESLRETLCRGEVWQGEFISRGKDGSERFERACIAPIREFGHRITHYVAIKQDITEAKRMAAELEDHRDHLKELVQRRTDEIVAIFRALPDSYFRLDRRGTVLECLTTAQTGLHVPPEQYTRTRLQDVLRPAAARALERAIERIEQGEPIVYFEHEIVHLNGVSTYETRLLPLGTDQLVAVVRDVTERNRAEERLRESEENFRTFFDTVADMTLVCSLAGRILYANPALDQTLGFGATELAAMQLWDLYGPGDRNEATTDFGAMIGGERSTCRVPLTSKDGRRVPAETRAWHGRWSGVDCFFIVAKDLTAEVEAQQRFEKLFRNNPALMAVTSVPDSVFQDVNDTWLSTLGYSREEVIGKSGTELDLFTEPALFARTRALNQDYHFRDVELKIKRKDGGLLDGLFSGEQIHGLEGECRLTVMLDITARKAAERKLEEERRRLANIIDGTQVATWEWNVQTGEYVLDERWARLVGYTLEELTPASIDTWRRLAHPDDLEMVSDLVRRHFSGELPYFDAEYRLRHKAGHWVWTASRGQLSTRNAEGKPLMMLGTQSDITPRKRSEQELREAREAAEAASRAKSAFLANMSHEIRTPLNAVIGLTYLLRRETTVKRHRDQLDKVIGAANHLLEIINDLLDLSKIEAGKMLIETTDFDVEAVVSEVCDLVSESAATKDLELVVDVGALPAQLHGDGLRLRQVLLNFLSNAIKFTECGHIRLCGYVVTSTKDTTLVRFEVSDTGIGLSAEQQKRLFRMFEQADVSTTRKYGGTGLGLVLARRIVDLMDGEVGCQSALGHGSTFWMVVPFTKADTPDVCLEQRSCGREADLRALVVDDLAVARKAIAKLLQSQGVPTDVAASGGEAIDLVQAADRRGEPYGLVIIDRKMPGLDGIETGRSLRDAKLKRTPALLLIGTEGEGPATLRQDGFTGYVRKPISLKGLRSAWNSEAGGATVEAEEPPASSEAERVCAGAVRGRGLRVLLAEDNELNREVATDLLEAVGFIVDSADDGHKAVSRAQIERYDIVLMDVQMPEMNGLDATRQIRSIPGYARTPIIAMTASAFQDEREACRAAGMDDHVAKPVDPDEFYRTLLRWLERGETSNAAEAVPETAAPAKATRDSLPWLRPDLETVADMDVEAGLRSVRGKTRFYARLLGEFCRNHVDDMSRVRECMARGDRNGAQLIAHSLKGLTQTFGISGVALLALELEVALKQNGTDETCLERAQAVDSVLRQTVGRIESVLKLRMSSEPSARSVALGQGLVELRRLLATDDLRAVALYENLEGELQRILGSAADRLKRELNSFAFTDALRTLNELADKLRSSEAPPG